MTNSIVVAKAFIHELNVGTFENAKKLFSDNAVVIAPSGSMTADDFLHHFYADNLKSEAKIFHLFPNSSTSKNVCGIYLQLKEYKKNGIIIEFDSVGVFECVDSKIFKLTILFDTFPIRKEFPDLFIN